MRRLLLLALLIALTLSAIGCASESRDEVRERSDYRHDTTAGYRMSP